MSTNRENRLRRHYQRVLEICIIISLMMLISVFFSFRKYESHYNLPDLWRIDDTFDVLPPITRIPKKIERPPVAPVPVEQDEDDMLDAVTFEPQQINIAEVPIPPPPPVEEEIFEVYQLKKKPVLIHKELPVYPELARRMGHQGRVVLKLAVGKDGFVESVSVLQDDPLLREAAIAAAMKYRFSPARQGIRNVKVWISIPFVFRLK